MDINIEKEVRKMIPILARRCGLMDDDVIKVMWKVCNEELEKHE